jgi:RNA polymerase sigma factor (sigma-70 family)
MALRRASNVIEDLRKAVLVHDGAGLSDGELLACFVERRDEAAFAALLRRHGPMVWGVCRRLLSHHDAEDAFQAAFLVLARKAGSIRPREMVANWLHGVAHQTALQARRTAARRTARERQVMDMAGPLVGRHDLWADLRPLLDQELRGLPQKYRAVIVLCDLEGKTRKEAARQLRCPEGTVAGRLARARALLAKRLARQGGQVSAGAVAAVLSESVAPACVPAAVVCATLKTVNLLTTGQALAGSAISANVARLAEGVLKSMLLTKLKTTTVALLVCVTGILLAGLAYSQVQNRLAGPSADDRSPQAAPSRDQPGQPDLVRQLRAEVQRLKAENEELRKRLQQQARPAKAPSPKLPIKVYPVLGLIGEGNPDGTEADALIKVIVKTIEPESWSQEGGIGSITYFPGAACLVVRQTPAVQGEVAELLMTLGKAKSDTERPAR